MRSHDKIKGGIHNKKREDLFLIQKAEGKSEGVYSEEDEEGIYLSIKVTINSTGVFCRKKRWEEENGIRLSIS